MVVVWLAEMMPRVAQNGPIFRADFCCPMVRFRAFRRNIFHFSLSEHHIFEVLGNMGKYGNSVSGISAQILFIFHMFAPEGISGFVSFARNERNLRAKSGATAYGGEIPV